MSKRFLFIFRAPPDTGYGAGEILDMALTAAAFEQPVALLFLDDGVFQLQRAERPATAGSASPDFQLLQMYEVEAVWVENESLAQWGLSGRDLAIPVETIGRAEIAALIAGRDVVVTF